VVVLDRAGLVDCEVEPAEKPGREPRVPDHGRPLLVVQLVGLAQDAAVDGHLAEVVQTAGPAQPPDVRVREAERLAKPLDVLRDPVGVPERVRVALVDDVRKRLERPSGLGAEKGQARL
jgi:hypothetical protein